MEAHGRFETVRRELWEWTSNDADRTRLVAQRFALPGRVFRHPARQLPEQEPEQPTQCSAAANSDAATAVTGPHVEVEFRHDGHQAFGSRLTVVEPGPASAAPGGISTTRLLSARSAIVRRSLRSDRTHQRSRKTGQTATAPQILITSLRSHGTHQRSRKTGQTTVTGKILITARANIRGMSRGRWFPLPSIRMTCRPTKTLPIVRPRAASLNQATTNARLKAAAT